jgi:hypothetical protein
MALLPSMIVLPPPLRSKALSPHPEEGAQRPSRRLSVERRSADLFSCRRHCEAVPAVCKSRGCHNAGMRQ